MKTNVVMKIAVVFMAAFGAYAFSGNNANNNMQLYSINDITGCTDILADCSDSGNFTCIILKDGVTETILDLECMREIKHITDQEVSWKPAPNGGK